VWDRVSCSIRKTNHNSSISRLFGAYGHLTTFRSGLAFGTYEARGAIVTDLQ
jgi:hypothetical protein